MGWNASICWIGPKNRLDRIPRFLELLCGFCFQNHDDGTRTFPERVAANFRQSPGEITDDDIEAAKRLGAARNMTPDVIHQLQNSEAIQQGLDPHRLPCGIRLFDLDDDLWEQEGGIRDRIQEIVCACTALNNVRSSVATKILWLKRPNLIPICDRDVRTRLLGAHQDNAENALLCIDRIRCIGRTYADLLEEATRFLDGHLPLGDAYRALPHLRALEAILWYHSNDRARGIYASLLGPK